MRVLELRVLEELVTQWKEMSEREILCFDTQAKQRIKKGRQQGKKLHTCQRG